MIRIVLTEEQTEAIMGASEPIDLVDSSGRMLGRMTRELPDSDQTLEMTSEELADLKRRMESPGPGVTTKELIERLQSTDKA